jgi:hypothetical protein
MKAIVLTYDRNKILTEHMIRCYEELWPEHPFTFRIPFQDSKRCFQSPSREYIRTPPTIKPTILRLIEDLDDEEWIYWCIDDKYPIQLEISKITNIFHAIINHENDNINGILFCRVRRMFDPDCVMASMELAGKESLLERKAYHQIWIHQFIQVKVLRHLFTCFPDIIRKAKDMDYLKNELIKPVTHRLFVTETNLCIFGESLISGNITQNCLKSLSEKGFPIPQWQSCELADYTVIGEL